MTTTPALAAAFDGACQCYSKRVAITENERALTYRELRETVTDFSDAYRSAGIGRDDRIVTSTTNGAGFIAAAAAAWECGAVHVGADAEWTSAELSRVISLTGARLLLYEPRSAREDTDATLRALRAVHPGLGTAIVGPYAAFEALDVAPADRVVAAESDADEPAIIFVSSGTTGVPKATVGYHRNLT